MLADGPRAAAELAQLTQAHAPSLYRVLRLLAALNVLREQPSGHFALTPLGERLRTGVPGSLRYWALLTDQLVPLHRGLDGFKFNGGLGGPRARPDLDAARDARGPPDEAGAFEGEHHLMHAGWRDLEVPLHVGFRGRVAEDTAVGVDEGQVLTLLVGERGSRGQCQTINS